MKILNILRKVKDNRKGRGKRYPLASLLALIILSRLCGYKDVKSAWHLCNQLSKKQLHKLGFKHFSTPSHPTLLSALQNADITSMEESFSEVVMYLNKDGYQFSIDGKTLSGRKNEEGNVYHLVSAFCSELGGVVMQNFSKPGGGEIDAALSLLEKINIKNNIITGDALYAQSSLCEKIVSKEGNYVFTVKDNQAQLRHELLQIFRTNPWPEKLRCYSEDVEKAHGRIEKREIQVMNWPYVHRKDGFSTIKQAAIITRYREDLHNKKGVASPERVFLITSLSEKQAGPKELLQYNRNHWAVENQLHWHRDTLFGEDQQTIRCFDSPHASAAISNLSLFLIKRAKNKSTKTLKNLSFSAITKHFARNISIPYKILFSCLA